MIYKPVAEADAVDLVSGRDCAFGSRAWNDAGAFGAASVNEKERSVGAWLKKVAGGTRLDRAFGRQSGHK